MGGQTTIRVTDSQGSNLCLRGVVESRQTVQGQMGMSVCVLENYIKRLLISLVSI
jgi:hypothetical protein